MSREPSVLDVALTQFETMETPTVIVPVLRDGHECVFYASYQGDAEWMALARAERHQVEVTIACCKRAYADARAWAGARPRPSGEGR